MEENQIYASTEEGKASFFFVFIVSSFISFISAHIHIDGHIYFLKQP